MSDDASDLLAQLRALHVEQSSRMQAEWQRSVPFGDLIADRWARAKALGFADGASIYDSALVLGDVQVGANTWIGPQVVLDGSGGLVIGATCSISAGVQVYTHDSIAWALSGGRAAYAKAPVEIGDHCYIGPLSVIAKGVRIGAHSLVAANSVVTKSVPSHSIVGGSPAKVIGTVTVHDDGTVHLAYHDRDTGAA